MENTLSVHVLGSLNIQFGSQPVTGFISSKAKALFIYLAVTARPWNRSSLATLLWGDLSETAARRNLSKCLSNLRRLVGDYLEIDRHSVAFQTEKSYWLDANIFEQMLADAFRSLPPSIYPTPVQGAVLLYRGDFLEGFFVRNAPDFEAWMRTERERLRGLQREALVCLSSHANQVSDLGQAIRWTQQLLQLEPTDEQAHRQLMALLARNGQRTLALAQYTTCCQILAQELDVEPAAETIELYAQIRDGGELRPDESSLAHQISNSMNLRHMPPVVDGQSLPPTPHKTQARSTSSEFPALQDEQQFSLTGRDEEWRRLRTAWQQALVNDTHFCLIHGEAGVGKTRLAEELLNWAQEQDIAIARTRAYAAAGELAYAPIVEWLRSPPLQQALHTLDEVWLMEIARVLPELASDSHREMTKLPAFVPMDESQWQRQRLFDALVRAFHAGTHPKVLLIDDVQWCDGESLAWLHYFLQGSRQVSTTISATLIVGTARPEIWHEAHALAPMLTHLRSAERMSEIALGPLDASATATLATQVTQAVLTATERAELYRYTEGNPLFVIESVRAGPWQTESSKVVEDEHKTARPSLPTALDEQPTPLQSALPPKIQAVIQERLAQLSPPARALVGLAAVIGRSFDFALLRQASAGEEADVVAGLDELWQQGIVRAHSHQHYDFSHDRIRDVAYLTVGPVQRPVWHRQVAEALETLHAADVAPVSAQLAFHYEVAGETEHALGYYQQAAERAHGVFADAEAVDLLNRALALLEQLPATRRTQEIELSILLQLREPLVTAQGYFAPTLGAIGLRTKALAEEVGNTAQLIHALQSLHSFYQMRAEYGQARSVAEEMVHLADQVYAGAVQSKDKENQAFLEAHRVLAHTLLYQGELVAAQRRYERIIDIESVAVQPLAFAAMNLWLLGYPERARLYACKTLIKSRSQPHPILMAFATNNIARVHHFMQQPNNMKQLTKTSLALAETYDIPFFLILNRLFQGRIWAEEGQAKQGIAQIQAMLIQLDEKNHAAFRTYFLSLLAESCAFAHQFAQALETLDQALSFVARNGERFWHAELVRLRGDYRLARGAPPGAVEACYEEAIAIAQAQQAKSLELRATVSLARLLQQQGGQAVAHQRLAAIYNWFTEGFTTADLRKAKILLAELSPG